MNALVFVVVAILLYVIPAWLSYNMGGLAGRRWYVLFGVVLGWIGAAIVALLTQRERQERRRIKAEQESREEELETGQDAETRKLRKFGLQ